MRHLPILSHSHLDFPDIEGPLINMRNGDLSFKKFLETRISCTTASLSIKVPRSSLASRSSRTISALLCSGVTILAIFLVQLVDKILHSFFIHTAGTCKVVLHYFVET